MRQLTIFLFLFLTLHVYAQEATLAPDFEMQLEDGTIAKLSDYQDNVVYISFWASWCGPCIKNFKKYKEIRAQLAKEGIILLNVSIDESEEKWEEAVQKLDIQGINAIASKADLYPSYEVFSIPLYEIIGKDGKFRYLSNEINRDILGHFKNWIQE